MSLFLNGVSSFEFNLICSECEKRIDESIKEACRWKLGIELESCNLEAVDRLRQEFADRCKKIIVEREIDAFEITAADGMEADLLLAKEKVSRYLSSDKFLIFVDDQMGKPLEGGSKETSFGCRLEKAVQFSQSGQSSSANKSLIGRDPFAFPDFRTNLDRARNHLSELIAAVRHTLEFFNGQCQTRRLKESPEVLYLLCLRMLQEIFERRCVFSDSIHAPLEVLVFPSLAVYPASDLELANVLLESLDKAIAPLLFANGIPLESEQAAWSWLNEHIFEGEIRSFVPNSEFLFALMEDLSEPVEGGDSSKLKEMPSEYLERNLRLEFGETIDYANQKANETIAHLVASVASKEELTHDDCQMVSKTIQDLRWAINQAAVRELFAALRSDHGISQSVVQAFEGNWSQGEGSLIGADIFHNQSLLTRERRDAILENARQLSKLAEDFEMELRSLEAKIQEDVRLGRVVVSQKPLALKYKDFFELQKKAEKRALSSGEMQRWKREYQRIINDAWLRADLQKALNPHKITGTIIENEVIAKLGFGSQNDALVRERRAQAESEVLKVLLQGEGLEAESIDALQKHAEDEKQNARLRASGILPQHICAVKEAIWAFEEAHRTLEGSAAPYLNRIEGVGVRFPNKARKSLLAQKMNLVISKNRRALTDLMTGYTRALKLMMSKEENVSLAELNRTLDRKLEPYKSGEAYRQIDDTLRPDIEFYSKYGNAITQEMIQGLENGDEVFKQGVCLAIALRWAMGWLRSKDVGAAPSKTTQIRAKDRFRQLLHSVSVSFNREEKSRLEKIFPESLRRSFGIKDIKSAFTKRGIHDIEADLRQCIETNLTRMALPENSADKRKGGVALIAYGIKGGGGHGIAIQYEEVSGEGGMPEKLVAKIGDANIGIIDIPDRDGTGRLLTFLEQKNLFFSCLADTMRLF